MTKIKSDPDIVKATSEGKLYVNNSDFFSLEKVKETICELPTHAMGDGLGF